MNGPNVRRHKRLNVVISLLLASAILCGAMISEPVYAGTTTKFYSTFESIESEPDWIRKRNNEDDSHPYMSNGLLTTARSGISRPASWLPPNYTYQCSFFLSSTYDQYSGMGATLFAVYQSSISTGIFEVQATIAGSTDPRLYVSGYSSDILMYDHTYLFNLTVSNNRTCYATLWSYATGLDVISSDSQNPASMVAYGPYQMIYIGSLSMESGPFNAHNLYVNYAKLDYWSGWDSSEPDTTTAWGEPSDNVGLSVKLLVFFIPIMILAWSFGRPGFLVGASLMTIIWLFTSSDFTAPGVLMFAAIGTLAYRGGV